MLQATDFTTIARQAAQFIMPEGIMTLFACAALVLDVMLPRNRKRLVGWVSLAGVGFAFISLWILYTDIVTKGAPRTAFFDMIVLDSYAVAYGREAQHFADILDGAAPLVDFRDGVAALALAEAAARSAKTGERVLL